MDSGGIAKLALTVSIIAAGASGFVCVKNCCGPKEDFDSKVESVITNFITKKPDAIVEAMNKGAIQKREDALKQLAIDVAASKKELSALAMKFGPSSSKTSIFAFVDPTCPHCLEFERNVIQVLEAKKNISFNIVPVAVLGEDSVTIGKIYYALYAKSPEKALAFMKFVINTKEPLDKANIEKGLKSIGVNYEKEVEPGLEEADIKLIKNGEIAQKLSVPMVPAIFVVNDKKAEMLANPDFETICSAAGEKSEKTTKAADEKSKKSDDKKVEDKKTEPEKK